MGVFGAADDRETDGHKPLFVPLAVLMLSH